MLSLLQRALAWILFVIAVSWLKYSLASEQEAVHWVAAVADNASQQIRFTLSAQPATPNVHKNTLAQISSVTLTGHPDQLFTFCAELRSASGLTKESGISYIMKGYKARLVPDKLWQCPNTVPGAFRQDFIVSDQPFVAHYSYSQNKTKPDSSKSQLGDRYASVLSMPGLVDRDNIDRMLLYGFGIDNDRGDDSDDKRYGKFLPDGEKNTISLYLQPLFNRLAFLTQQALLVNVSNHSGGRNLVVRQNGREITRIRLTREDVLYLLNNEQMTSVKAVLEWLRFRMNGREKLTHLLLDIQSGLIDHNSPEDEAFQDSVLEQLATILELDDRDFSFNFEMEQLIKTWSDSASDKMVTHGGGTTTSKEGSKSDKNDSQKTGSPDKEKDIKKEKKLPDDSQKGSGRGGGQDNKPSGGQKKEGETTPTTTIIERRTIFTSTYFFKSGFHCYKCEAPLDATSTQTSEGKRYHKKCVPETATSTYHDKAAIMELENVQFKCQDCNQELKYLAGTKERSNLVTHALTHLHKCGVCGFFLDSPNHKERAIALKAHAQGICYTSCPRCEVVLPGKELITHSRTTCSNRLVTCPVLDCKSEKHCRELIQHINDHLGDQSHTQASATPNSPMLCPLCLGIENNLATLSKHMVKCIATSTCQLKSDNGEGEGEGEYKPEPHHPYKKVKTTCTQPDQLPPIKDHTDGRSKDCVPQQTSDAVTMSRRELKLAETGQPPSSGSAFSSGPEEFSPSRLHSKNTASFSAIQRERLLQNAKQVLTQVQFQTIQPLISHLADTANRQSPPFTQRKLRLVKTAVDRFVEEYDRLPRMLELKRGGLSDKLAKGKEGTFTYVLHELAEDIYSLLHLDVVQLATADFDSPNDQLQILATLKKRVKEQPVSRQSQTQVSTSFDSLQRAIQRAKPEGDAVIPLGASMSVSRSLKRTLKETLNNPTLIKHFKSLDISAVATAMKPVLLAELCQTPELAYNQQLIGSIRTEFTPRSVAVTSGMTVFEQKRYLNMLIGARSAQRIITSAKQEFKQQWQLAIEQACPEKQAGEHSALLAVCSGQAFFAQAVLDPATLSIVQSKGAGVVQKTLKYLRSGVIKQPAVEPQKDKQGTWLTPRKPEVLQVKTGPETHAPSQACLLMAIGEMPLTAMEGADPITLAVLMHFKKKELVKQSKAAILVSVGEGDYKVLGRNLGHGSAIHAYKDRDLYEQLPHVSQEMIPTEDIARRTLLEATSEGDPEESLDDIVTVGVAVSKRN